LVEIGYTMMCEQRRPQDLVEDLVLAEGAGFDFSVRNYPSQYVLFVQRSVCYPCSMSRKKQPKPRPKRPYPSYEEGELRDKSIEEKMDPQYRRESLQRLIKKAASNE
jgi:hypothetical protein